MGFNEIVITVLALVALILAVIDEFKAQGQSTTHYAIGALAVAILWLMLAP
jgi:glycerol uptake facilitator-like aquaporin